MENSGSQVNPRVTEGPTFRVKEPEGRVNPSPWYVTGLVEGEGTFTYSRSGRRLALYFAVKLTAVDRPLLETIQRFFGGIGRIYTVRPRAATPTSGFTRTASYYRVSRPDELKLIVAHFDHFPLRGAKRESFHVWREMVLLMRGTLRKPPWDEISALADKLSAASPRHAEWS